MNATDDSPQKPVTHDFTAVFLEELEDIMARRKRQNLSVNDPENEISRIRKAQETQDRPECEINGDEERFGFYSVLPGTGAQLTGLTLSGGGIRSATFNLGLLQGLANFNFLKNIDYLSTVSGGGYIGTCMTSLLNSDTDSVGLETDNFPLGRSRIGKSEDPSIEKEPVRRLRYFSSYLMAEGGFISRYIRPAMVFTRGAILNFFLIIPYIIFLGLMLAFLFNINSIIPLAENNGLFFDHREFGSALDESSRKLNQANAELLRYAAQKTEGLDFPDNSERIEWVIQHDPDEKLESILTKIRDAKSPLKREWHQIWFLPSSFFGLMILIALFCRTCYSSPYLSRCRFNNIMAILFFTSLVLLFLQLYGILIIYWQTWNISSWIASASILSLTTPNLLRNIGKTGTKGLFSFKSIFAVILLMLVPLFILFVTGVIIVYLCRGNIPVTTGMIGASIVLMYINRRFINLNEISLHSYYRDCLCRAYMMYYEHKANKPSSRDTLKFSKLDSKKAPYHIYNTTLNLKKRMPEGENPGTFRTGESFIFSKNRTGSSGTGYARTEAYEKLDEHIDTGTAMAISGAAANIGMAQKNMPLFRLLMGLLNIRLGYWALHPKQLMQGMQNMVTRSFPGSSETFQECLNAYRQNSRYINLSDGGHFDNIGVYELLRRRCRYIIVGDAEADPRYSFEAISYIMRLARIDFGIEIRIDISDIKPDPITGFSKKHCAVGTIEYPEGDFGYLLYFKASLTGDEPVHLHEYRVKHSAFPHQTTADQWFDEQQFEAYRELGYHVVKNAFSFSKNDIAAKSERITDPNTVNGTGKHETTIEEFARLFRETK